MRILNFLIVLLILTSCDPTNGNAEYTKTIVKSHKETKETLKEQEQARPINFVTLLDPESKKNWINQWVVKGNIKNHASIATYKDILINISFYTKTDTYIGTVHRTIQEFFKPNSVTGFKFHLNEYPQAKYLKVRISDVVNTEK